MWKTRIKEVNQQFNDIDSYKKWSQDRKKRLRNLVNMFEQLREKVTDALNYSQNSTPLPLTEYP